MLRGCERYLGRRTEFVCHPKSDRGVARARGKVERTFRVGCEAIHIRMVVHDNLQTASVPTEWKGVKRKSKSEWGSSTCPTL